MAVLPFSSFGFRVSSFRKSVLVIATRRVVPCGGRGWGVQGRKDSGRRVFGVWLGLIAEG
jgi:hypothetical protein